MQQQQQKNEIQFHSTTELFRRKNEHELRTNGKFCYFAMSSMMSGYILKLYCFLYSFSIVGSKQQSTHKSGKKWEINRNKKAK